jgi:hypothetical protein
MLGLQKSQPNNELKNVRLTQSVAQAQRLNGRPTKQNCPYIYVLIFCRV